MNSNPATTSLYASRTISALCGLWWNTTCTSWNQSSLASRDDLYKLDALRPQYPYEHRLRDLASRPLYFLATDRLFSQRAIVDSLERGRLRFSEWNYMRGDDGSTGKISSARCNEELVCAAYNVASALSQALAIEYDKIGQDERIAKFATHAFAAIEELVCLLARWRRGNLAHVDGNISVQSNGTDRTEKTPIPLPLHLSTEGLELMTDIAFAQLGEQWLTNYDSSSQPSAGSRSVSMAYTIWNAYGSAYDKLRTWADGAGLGDMDQEHLTPVPGHLARLTAVKRHYYFARSAMDAMNLVADEKNGSG